MIVGMVLGASAGILALLICIDLGAIEVIDVRKKEEEVPTLEDIERMSRWYEENYGRKGR